MRTDAEIELLVRGFEDGTLPRTEWNHRAHLTVALWYSLRHPRHEATRLIREGVKRYNTRHGNAQGYHETITLAWVAVIAEFLATQGRTEPLPKLVNALTDACASKDYLLRYYSREVLMSDDARRSWIPPDRRPIEPDAR